MLMVWLISILGRLISVLYLSSVTTVSDLVIRRRLALIQPGAVGAQLATTSRSVQRKYCNARIVSRHMLHGIWPVPMSMWSKCATSVPRCVKKDPVGPGHRSSILPLSPSLRSALTHGQILGSGDKAIAARSIRVNGKAIPRSASFHPKL